MKYIRRLLWFVATRLAAISVIVGLLVLVFYLAMNTANIYLLLSDGMKLRTGVILTREDAEELTSFFTDDFLMSDETLSIGLSQQSPYVDYNIDTFNYEMTMEWMWAWPWENTATATIVEKVLTLPEIPAAMTLPCSTAQRRIPETANSRSSTIASTQPVI